MALPLLFILFLTTFSTIPGSESKLSVDYYDKKCPRFHDIVQETTYEKQTTSPTTAPATLRLFFHDCMVEGCDASVMLRPTASNQTEMVNDINHSLAGDGFDVVTRIKTKLELECPGIVSCSDILAEATRNLITMTGGPHYNVRLGRKDGFTSRASSVEGHLSRSNSSMDQMIAKFQAVGFNVQELVALVGGGHTIGFVHCSEFSSRIFGPHVDPSLNPALVDALKRTCANYTANPTMSVFLDVLSPGVFDNSFLKNLKNGLGVLQSDHALIADPRTSIIVEKYAQDNNLFFQEFGRAMEKLSLLGVRTGHKGEVRRRCDVRNN